MMEQTTLSHIINHLWPEDTTSDQHRVYAVLDGARDTQIEPMVRASQLPHDCLYYAPLSDDLRAAAPHIVELAADADFTRQLLQQGWGKSWGIFLITCLPTNLATVRHNCRKMNFVLGPSGQKMLFRYYDPRVLRTYLPTCTLDEVQTVFGPVKEIIMEGEKATLLHRFQHGEQGSKATLYNV